MAARKMSQIANGTNAQEPPAHGEKQDEKVPGGASTFEPLRIARQGFFWRNKITPLATF